MREASSIILNAIVVNCSSSIYTQTDRDRQTDRQTERH